MYYDVTYLHGVECFTMIIEKVFQCQLLRNFDRENQNVRIHPISREYKVLDVNV